jgi:hypothetical protein
MTATFEVNHYVLPRVIKNRTGIFRVIIEQFRRRGNRLAVLYGAASTDEFRAFGNGMEKGVFDLVPIISSSAGARRSFADENLLTSF